MNKSKRGIVIAVACISATTIIYSKWSISQAIWPSHDKYRPFNDIQEKLSEFLLRAWKFHKVPLGHCVLFHSNKLLVIFREKHILSDPKFEYYRCNFSALLYLMVSVLLAVFFILHSSISLAVSRKKINSKEKTDGIWSCIWPAVLMSTVESTNDEYLWIVANLWQMFIEDNDVFLMHLPKHLWIIPFYRHTHYKTTNIKMKTFTFSFVCFLFNCDCEDFPQWSLT